ncbi:unnamed protein product [Cuscuta campestris]|uniref:Uncharacterized protein n=1 Tax=Cuscuta campestris TaxID=132261 RepID=A0A484NEH9_9ASTE|nr:unnamed protein product [Cuscuta campestris]
MVALNTVICSIRLCCSFLLFIVFLLCLFLAASLFSWIAAMYVVRCPRVMLALGLPNAPLHYRDAAGILPP